MQRNNIGEIVSAQRRRKREFAEEEAGAAGDGTMRVGCYGDRIEEKSAAKGGLGNIKALSRENGRLEQLLRIPVLGASPLRDTAVAGPEPFPTTVI